MVYSPNRPPLPTRPSSMSPTFPTFLQSDHDSPTMSSATYSATNPLNPTNKATTETTPHSGITAHPYRHATATQYHLYAIPSIEEPDEMFCILNSVRVKRRLAAARAAGQTGPPRRRPVVNMDDAPPTLGDFCAGVVRITGLLLEMVIEASKQLLARKGGAEGGTSGQVRQQGDGNASEKEKSFGRGRNGDVGDWKKVASC